MSKTKMILTGALLALAAFALLLAPPSALAAKKNMVKVKGFIVAVDPDAVDGPTVTIDDPASDTDVEVKVVDSTKIHKDNVEGAAIGDLKVGDKATAKYNADTMEAKRIQAKTPQAKVHGVITEVGTDVGEGTPVTIEDAEGNPVTVLVTADTKITLNGEPATVDDLAEQQQAKAKYYTTSTIAKFIHASDEPDDDEED